MAKSPLPSVPLSAAVDDAPADFKTPYEGKSNMRRNEPCTLIPAF